jgi:hypothetical protein
MIRLTVTSIVFALFAVLGNVPAVAAPQVLAVLSTGNGAAMICEDGVCTASLSTYCLQQYRTPPDLGAPYHAANPTSFTLELAMADGTHKSILAPNMLSYRAERGYKSVEVAMSSAVLDDHGAVSARLLVGAKASLIPDPEEGDLNPLTEAEIALAVGPSRIMGSKIVDGSPEAKTARALGVMLRAIPEWQGWPQTTREGLWEMIDGVVAQESIEGGEYSLIETEFNACADAYEDKKYFGIGFCIRQHHDAEILKLNKTYWESQAGS